MLKFESMQNALNKAEEKLVTVPEDQKLALFDKLKMDMLEKKDYFDLNSYMFASQIIDLDTSNYIYRRLMDWDDTNLGERIVVTQALGELAQLKLRMRLEQSKH